MRHYMELIMVISDKPFNLLAPGFPHWYHEVVGLGDLKMFSNANVSASSLYSNRTRANEDLITNYLKQWKIQASWPEQAGGWRNNLLRRKPEKEQVGGGHSHCSRWLISICAHSQPPANWESLKGVSIPCSSLNLPQHLAQCYVSTCWLNCRS